MHPRLVVLLFALSLTPWAQAEAQRFDVPGAGWGLKLDLPGLKKQRDQGDADSQYAFEGDSERFHLTFFVERPPVEPNTGTAQEVRAYYWAKALRHPLIDAASVKTSEGPGYVKVEYFYRGKFAGREVNMKNVNYYAAHAGRWIDVHLSVHGSVTEADEDALAQLERSLAFVATP